MNPAKILLINPEDITRYQRYSELTPFAGLACIASYLKMELNRDVDVTVTEMLPQKIGIEHVVKNVVDNKIDICGITSKTYNFLFAKRLADSIKRASPNTTVIFGGAHASALPEATLENSSISAIVKAEGEIPFTNIVKNHLGGQHLFEGVKGIVYKSNGDVITGPDQELIKNLDGLPFTGWGEFYDLNNYEKYFDNDRGRFYRSIPVFASRSCPYKCYFCQPVLTRTYRIRSVDNVLDEIELLVERYGIGWQYFEDSIFGLRKTWFMDFCQKYISRGLNNKVKWGFETNVNCIDSEQFEAAKEAGCTYIYFGLESASDIVLKGIGKGISRKKISVAVESAKKAGINEVTGSFIFGMPHETIATAHETIDYIKESKLDKINVNILDVYPGTALYHMVNEKVGGIRWIEDKKDVWDACGRTLVKTLVNDLDSAEKINELYIEATKVLYEKYKRSRYKFFRKALYLSLYYLINDRKRLRQLLIRAMISSKGLRKFKNGLLKG